MALAEGKILVAHIATGRGWGVDCTAEFSGAVVAIASWGRGVFVVGVRASDDDLERILILSRVRCFLYRYRRAPEGAFVVSRARWIWAIVGASVQARVSFNVHVECLAARCLVALRSASEGVVGGKGVESHVI